MATTTDTRTPVLIALTTRDVRVVNDAAELSLRRWQDHPGHYANTLRSHFYGRAGELAVVRWVHQHEVGYWPHCEDPEREPLCDVELFYPHVRIEVKTWSAAFWPDLGRCVAASQGSALRRKADVVVWCVAEEPTRERGMTVQLRGWNLVNEILSVPPRLTGLPGRRQVANYQLYEHQLRPMDGLLSV